MFLCDFVKCDIAKILEGYKKNLAGRIRNGENISALDGQEDRAQRKQKECGIKKPGTGIWGLGKMEDIGDSLFDKMLIETFFVSHCHHAFWRLLILLTLRSLSLDT